MKASVLTALSWAIVVHALIDGKQQDIVVDVAPNYVACTQEMSAQKINGECFEVESVIHQKAF